ncbi:hypothetical protein R6Q59_031049 [Mikania micrantha]
MHRQSIGSPASQIQCHGVLFSGAGVIKDDTGNDFISDDHRKDKLAPCPASSVDDVERKSQKSNQQKSMPVPSSPRLIHLIPILMFFCFLILYLSSHDPSKQDLAQNSGFTTLPSKKTAIDSIDVDDTDGGGSMEIEKTVLAIRSMRNLQQDHRHLLHRKFLH